MKTNMQAGQITDSGFEILEVVELAELEAVGIWARHRKSGTQVFHVLNDDTENLFAFAFATTPEDSTGVAHILEHSVLCGSKNYPLKDAFLVLAQGSLQTYLNAWTFPDKTVYPASSVNEHDYFNLMSVYGDAVFRPLISEWTFMQEGHRFIFSPEGEKKKSEFPGELKEQEKLSVTGVVYNEMKGAYSSLDTYAGLWSVRGVLPDTPYALESGGDPEAIPGLTWEGLRDFHRTRYSPANCRIFLAGNIPTEKQFAVLNERFLSVIPAGTAASPIPNAKGWTAPKTITVPCPAGGESKSMVFLSWRCCDGTETAEVLALSALTEILLGHDGSPLTRALVESGLGEDLAPVTGLESEIREVLFVAGLRGVDRAAAPQIDGQIEALILGELRRLVTEGIPPEEIEAALLSMEFSHREIRRSGGPFSLVWLRRSLRGWLHGSKPWESLLFAPNFAELRRRLEANDRYFESLIQKYLLDNPHRARINLDPEAGFLEKQDAALAAQLAEQEAKLQEADRRVIKEKAAELERLQSEGDSPAALATIPHLSRRDLSPDVETIPREIRDAHGVPVLTHELFTNGISYAAFAFPVDIFPPEAYRWLPFFSRVVVSMGLPGMDYGEVSSLMARTAGGFHGMLQNGSIAPGTARSVATPTGILDLTGRDWMVYRLKALDEKIGPSLDLALRLITEADFSDLRRIHDLVMEMKNEADSSLAPAGHYYASSRSGRLFSRAKAVGDIWNGLDQITFAHTLATLDTAEISRKLIAIRDRLCGAGLIANITGSAGALAGTFREIGEKFSCFGPPRPRNPASEGIEPFYAPKAGTMKPEVFASPSLQVGFASMSLPGAAYGTAENAAELVLAHQLSTGALWEDIRMKGGAYGAFASPDGIERVFSLSTYRDPNPRRSLDAFSAALKAGDDLTEESLVKAIIGCYAKESAPRTSAEKGSADFSRFLYGIEQQQRERIRRSMIALDSGQIAQAMGRLAAVTEGAPAVIIAGNAAAEKAASDLGTELTQLPV